MKLVVLIARDEFKNVEDDRWQNEWKTWKKFASSILEISYPGRSIKALEFPGRGGKLVVISQGQLIQNCRENSWNDALEFECDCLVTQLNCIVRHLRHYLTDNDMRVRIRMGIHGNIFDLEKRIESIPIFLFSYSSIEPKIAQNIVKLWSCLEDKSNNPKDCIEKFILC